MMKMTLNSDQLTTGMLGQKVELSHDTLSDEVTLNSDQYYRDVRPYRVDEQLPLATNV